MANQTGIFTKKELEVIEQPELGHDSWYMDNYQTRFAIIGGFKMELGQVLDATERVEDLFKQNPVDDKRVKKVAKAIFIDDHAQVKPIQIARLIRDDHELFYNVGGRHRAYAIDRALEQLTDGDEARFNQLIEVSLTDIQDEADLVKFIVCDNTSRPLRTAEAGHLDLQVYGAKAEGVKTVISTAIKADADDKERQRLLAQYFVRMAQQTKVMQPQTAVTIGSKVTKYIFGMMKNEPYTKLNLQQVGRLMARAWDITTEVIKADDTITNIGRAAGSIGDKTISQLGNEFDEIINPPKSEKKRQQSVVSVQTPSGEELPIA